MTLNSCLMVYWQRSQDLVFLKVCVGLPDIMAGMPSSLQKNVGTFVVNHKRGLTVRLCRLSRLP